MATTCTNPTLMTWLEGGAEGREGLLQVQLCICASKTRANLGEVVEAGGLLGEGQGIGAPFVVDGDEALLYVDVGGPILAHGAQLDQVALRSQLLQCKIKQLRGYSQRSSCRRVAVSKPPTLWALLLQRGIDLQESANVRR